ncbi:hypothetical protein ES705_45113 [subsurface metagenome]
MKKALLIISILSIIFLTGCGIFKIDGWIWPEDDLEFMDMVEELNTPQKVSDYMMENFEYELHNLWTPTPYFLWKRGKGDCNDFATFGVFIAHYHGYETYQIIISYIDASTKHMIAVYVEEELSFTDNRSYHYGFDSFREIVEFDCKYFPDKEIKKYIVKDYENNIIEVRDNYVH